MFNNLDPKWEIASFGQKSAKALDFEERYFDILVSRIVDQEFLLEGCLSADDATETEGKVLFPILNGRSPSTSYFCSILGHAFRTRGYEPIAMLCGGCLTRCTCDNRDRYDNVERGLCTSVGKRILEANDISVVYFSDISEEVGHEHIPESFTDALDMEYKGIEVARHAKGQLRANLQRYTIGERQRAEYERILRSAIQLVNGGERLFEEYDIDIIIGNHPTYLPGVIPAVGFKRGKNVYSMMSGRRDQTLSFGRWNDRSPLGLHTDRSLLNQILNHPLTSVEFNEIEEIMQGRASGSERRITYFNTSDRAIETEQWDNTVGLFTNLVWDAAVDVDEIVFSDPFSWVKTSIEAVPSDTLLIIKPHPAEKYRGTREQIGDWISNQYNQLPDNVKLLEPDTDISTYQLFDHVDLVSVWTSTVGIEAAYHGVPVIPAAAAHYRGFGFTEDVESVKQYTNVLHEVDRVELTDKMIDQARRYAHYMFIQREIDFPFFESKEGFEISLIEADHDDIAPSNTVFDKLVEQMITGEPVLSTRDNHSYRSSSS